jgi:hypothetical protein
MAARHASPNGPACAATRSMPAIARPAAARSSAGARRARSSVTRPGPPKTLRLTGGTAPVIRSTTRNASRPGRPAAAPRALQLDRARTWLA